MLSDTSLAEMRARAMQWIEPSRGDVVTRATALNEEHLALDVVELLEEVERQRALLATVRSALDDWDWSGLVRDARSDAENYVDPLKTIARLDAALKEKP